MKALMLSPEPPYPLQGGGAYRTASLLHYFARFAEVDLILLSDSGVPAVLPPGLVHSQQVIPLPSHNRGVAARYLRNASRAIRGVPPLIDRLAGLAGPIEQAIGNQHYDFGIVEHFWCAPYLKLLTRHCSTTILNLHNVESVLHERCAGVSETLVRRGHLRFAGASRKLESALLPGYSLVLATSENDAAIVRRIAPESRVAVFPNSLPRVPVPRSIEYPRIVFPGNFEYHPNIDAAGYLVREIWPEVRRHHPEVRLRLAGRGDGAIRHLLPRGPVESTGIEVTGTVTDALHEISQARLVVAPLRAGSGTRIKILEAWSAARCVVATPLAAEGLAAESGTNIALASNSGEFASEIVRLLNDAEARQHLGMAGRHTFEQHYCWENVWKKLDLDPQVTRWAGLNGYTGTF
jgi:polysaccharide biosynthesis protein PslH